MEKLNWWILKKKNNEPKVKEEKVNDDNCYHFRGRWKNLDRLVICSYGKNKKDAFIKMLQAKKQNKFKYRKGDNFYMTYDTNEEAEASLLAQGCSKSEAACMSVYGHTSYIVKDGKVTIN